jgi:hypothetical protein
MEMKFKNYITEKAKPKKKGYERSREEFVKAIDKAIDKDDKKMMKKIAKDLSMSHLKPVDRDSLGSYVYKLLTGM